MLDIKSTKYELFIVDNLSVKKSIFNKLKIDKQVTCICIDSIPSSGQPDEVLAYHKMDIISIVNRISKILFNN